MGLIKLITIFFVMFVVFLIPTPKAEKKKEWLSVKTNNLIVKFIIAAFAAVIFVVFLLFLGMLIDYVKTHQY